MTLFRKNVTKMPKKRGRPPKNGVAGTEAEKEMEARFIEIATNLNVTHDSLYRKSKFSVAQKIAACVAFYAVGTAKDAERYCLVPKETILRWRKEAEWWPVIQEEIRKFHTEEMDRQMTLLMDDMMGELSDRVNEGDYVLNKNGELIRKPMSGRDIAQASRGIFEIRALSRGDPTSRVERMSFDKVAEKLSTTFKEISREGELIEAKRVDANEKEHET